MKLRKKECPKCGQATITANTINPDIVWDAITRPTWNILFGPILPVSLQGRQWTTSGVLRHRWEPRSKWDTEKYWLAPHRCGQPITSTGENVTTGTDPPPLPETPPF